MFFSIGPGSFVIFLARNTTDRLINFHHQGPIPWLLTSELFDSDARGKALSLATFTNWIIAFVVVITYPMLEVKFKKYCPKIDYSPNPFFFLRTERNQRTYISCNWRSAIDFYDLGTIVLSGNQKQVDK